MLGRPFVGGRALARGVGHLCLLDESVSGCHLTVVYVRDRGMCIYYSPFLLVFVGYVILID